MNRLVCDKIREVCSVESIGERVTLHEPDFSGTDVWKNVKDCLDSGWVSSAGEWVDRFERMIEDYTGCHYAIAVTNGTVALRLALYLIGVRSGDEVLTSPMSFVATANAICHLGATPHFVDIEEERYGICPNALEERLKEIGEKRDGVTYNRKTGKQISGILPVHVFGRPLRIKEIVAVADEWGIPVVEDAAEALGSWVEGNHCGSFGKLGCFSFNGNKIITTGGGGALITNDSELAAKARHLSTTAKRSHPWEFFHDEIAWNDRMPNINAALGVAQLERFNSILEKKGILLRRYIKAFRDVEGVRILNLDSDSSNNWLITMKLVGGSKSHAERKRQSLLSFAHSQGIMLRPVWRLLNELPMFHCVPRGRLDTAEEVSPRLINLPSSPQLTDRLESVTNR